MEFKNFGKIARLSRDIVITEKIDGTNAQIFIYNKDDEIIFPDTPHEQMVTDHFVDKYCLGMINGCYIFAGSRKRWLTRASKGDNYGFAKWVKLNIKDLINLGEGRHYGEYYGQGIQRGYGLKEKRFSLFNVGRWHDKRFKPRLISVNSETKEEKWTNEAPSCCEVVPILYQGIFDTECIQGYIYRLKQNGSVAVPGYMKPEGLVVFHTASGQLFKKTLENDEKPKSAL